MRLRIYIILFVLSLLACTKDVETATTTNTPVTVGFWVGDPQTRTSINSDGITTSWDKNDRVALWADLKIGSNFFHRMYNKLEFDLYYRDRSSAMFTTTMAEIMPGDETTTYKYYATYPVPKSVTENLATFSLPTQQDGKIGNGAAIMVAEPDEAIPLRALTGAIGTPTSSLINENHLRLKMKHMMHALKFYVPSNKWAFDEGEKIERIVFTMPQSIAGDVTLDYTNPDFAVNTTNGVNEITLNLAEPIGPSESAAKLDFAAASIIPSGHSFLDGDQIVVKMYTKNQAAINYISLAGRKQMRAGHITPIGLDCSDARYQYVLRFLWGGNNLGEDVNYIRFYNSSGSQIYEIPNVTTFVNQGYHDIDFSFLPEDELHVFTDLAGDPITVEYESKHAIVTDSFTMPAVNGSGSNEVTLTVPYLFFEDFSGIATFDNDCDVGTGTSSSSAGNKDGVAFTWLNGASNGWKGSRAGGSEKHAVRMSCRFEGGGAGYATKYEKYPGRIDSRPITGLKSNAKLKISFDYIGGQDSWMKDANKEKGGTYGNPVLAYGYNTAGSVDFKGDDAIATVLKSGIQAESNGLWNSKYNTETAYIENCPNNTCLSWQVTVNRIGSETSWTGIFGANGNHYIYLDNIKVQIAE